MEENQNTNQNQQSTQMQPGSSNIISRVIGILTKPKEEWGKISQETPNVSAIIMGYALPLALIPAISTILGIGLIGKRISIGFGSVSVKSWGLGITSGVTVFIVSLAAVLITAVIIDALAKSFKSEKNFGRSLQLVVYSYTATWVAGIFNIIPAISFLAFLAGLYGIYLMYLGFEPVKKTPKENIALYLLATIGILIVVYVILSLIVGIIVNLIYAPNMGSFAF